MTWTVTPNAHAQRAAERVMILVDRPSAHPRLLVPFQQSPVWVLLLWIVTPSAIMSWRALLAEPLEARTSTMMAALGDRMEEARRRLSPLQRAAVANGLDFNIRIAHGPLAETAIRVAREERIQRLLVPCSWGEYYSRPQHEFLEQLGQRLRCPVASID